MCATTCSEHAVFEEVPRFSATSPYWKTPKGMLRRIDSLSQFFIYGIFNNATRILGEKSDVTWLIWVTAGDDRVCPKCVENSMGGDGSGRYKVDWFMPMMPAHDGCFIPGTLVNTIRGLVPIEDVVVGELVQTHRNRYRRVRQTHRRAFEGEIYRIRGNGLTGNHPVLTPEGWCRADSLNEGDKVVISTLCIKCEPSTGYLKTYKIPSSIAEKNLFTPILRPLGSGFMPVTPIDFNSQLDIGKGEIEIIDLEGILGHDLNTVGSEDFMESDFEGRKPTGLLSSHRLFNQIRSRGTHSRCLMCSLNLSSSLIRGHLSPSKEVSFTPSPYLNLLKEKSISDGSSGASIFIGEGLFGHSTFIESGDFVGRQQTLQYRTPTLNDIDTIPYKGLVYNLTVAEDESYIVGEGLIAHNCRCQWQLMYELLEQTRL